MTPEICKPHIWQRNGIWFCRVREPGFVGSMTTGQSISPEDAYRLWLASTSEFRQTIERLNGR